MAAKRGIGLEPMSAERENLNLKVDVQLLEDLKQFEERAKRLNRRFNRTQVVEEALRAAIDTNNEIFDAMEKDRTIA